MITRTVIPYTITGRTRTGQYWHRVWQEPHSGQVLTWCSHDLVTALRPKAIIDKNPLQLCWKKGCH